MIQSRAERKKKKKKSNACQPRILNGAKKVKSEIEVAQSCPTLCDPMDCSLPGSSVHGILHAKILGMGCHFLPQGIFPTQGSNPGLLQNCPSKMKEK